uniref:Uncharacterized protein n=1 Tax=Aeromonas salmonicida subsp. salmonicida TaxID=29491 RepID=A0A1I9S1X9_AERSS|nr:putative hypothetical protein [Aeromonas salmonicida subsp. salmonicida]
MIWAPSLQAVLAHLVDPFCIVIAWPSRCIPCPTEEQQGAYHQQHLHNSEPRSGAITIFFQLLQYPDPSGNKQQDQQRCHALLSDPLYQHLQRIPNHHVTLQNYQAAPFHAKYCIHIQSRKRTMPPRTSAPPTILPSSELWVQRWAVSAARQRPFARHFGRWPRKTKRGRSPAHAFRYRSANAQGGQPPQRLRSQYPAAGTFQGRPHTAGQRPDHRPARRGGVGQRLQGSMVGLQIGLHRWRQRSLGDHLLQPGQQGGQGLGLLLAGYRLLLLAPGRALHELKAVNIPPNGNAHRGHLLRLLLLLGGERHPFPLDPRLGQGQRPVQHLVTHRIDERLHMVGPDQPYRHHGMRACLDERRRHISRQRHVEGRTGESHRVQRADRQRAGYLRKRLHPLRYIQGQRDRLIRTNIRLHGAGQQTIRGHLDVLRVAIELMVDPAGPRWLLQLPGRNLGLAQQIGGLDGRIAGHGDEFGDKGSHRGLLGDDRVSSVAADPPCQLQGCKRQDPGRPGWRRIWGGLWPLTNKTKPRRSEA